MTFKAFALTTALIAGFSAPAFAQDAEAAIEAPATVVSGAFNLELNTVTELDGGACRLVYVAENATSTDVSNATYEVAVFNDVEGRDIVSNMLLLEFGELASGKTRVVQFDIAGQPCSDISKILVNNQVDCATADGTSDMCMGNLATRALDTEITFTH